MNFAVNGTAVGTANSEVTLPASGGSAHVTISAAALLDATPEFADEHALRGTRNRTGRSNGLASASLVTSPLRSSSTDALRGRRPRVRTVRFAPLTFDVPVARSSWIAVRVPGAAHTNPMFVTVGGAPIRASRASAEWCLAAVNQCWTQKVKNIRDSERDEARRAYNHAREVYKSARGRVDGSLRTAMPNRRSFLTTSLLAAPALAARVNGPERSAPRGRSRWSASAGTRTIRSQGAAAPLRSSRAAGHRVSIVYLTRGERGIDGKSLDEAARIRTAEAQRACEILKAAPIFAGQIDGATEFNADRMRAFIELLTNERPDIVLTHWPVDTHIDHQIASLLAFRAWLAARQSFSLFYFEVNAGEQTRLFLPTEYVDITPGARPEEARALRARQSGWRGHLPGSSRADGTVPRPRNRRRGCGGIRPRRSIAVAWTLVLD